MTAARPLHYPPIMSVHKSSDAPAVGQPFPFFQVLRYFKAFCRDNAPEVKASHRSLFYYLLELVEQRGVARLRLDRDSAMEGTGIGSKDAYTAALKQLHAWGLLHYTPGANGNRAAVVELLPKSSVPETGHNLGRYWDATQDTTQDTTRTTKELNDFNLLTSEREARARAEKKIGEQAEELVTLRQQLQAQATAAHTGGGAATEPLRVVPPAAEDDEWFARPRDVEMVDEFLRQHHQQRVRQHAGKGYLFWAEYAGKALPDGTWVFNSGRPMSFNWTGGN